MTPSSSDVFRGLRDAYVALCRAMSADPLVRVGDEPGCAWGMTPVPLLDLNRVTGIRLDARDADRQLVAIDDRYRAAGVEPSWWVDPLTTPTDLGSRLSRLSYEPLPDLVPAMGIEMRDVPPLLPIDGAELAFATDRDAVERSQKLFAEGYGLTAAAGEALASHIGAAATPAGPVRVVVASVDGVSAATALALLVGDLAGIYMVATLEAYRGRGLGRAVTLAVLHDAAARGARLAVLESSVLGHPVYRRIGFSDAGLTRLFVRRAAGG